MNPLTSQQRKLAYLAGIVVLLVPIILLGRPATREKGSGGVLAELRAQHDLGESTLGEVDPTSATMSFVLLGFRGIAVDILWIQADKEKEQKSWAALRTTVDSIIRLQPHFRKVWEFQGWNLAYNVSVSWDAVSDRYYWVKEGAKFLMVGTRRNERIPDLYWQTGRILGSKIGQADEWRYFRRFYKVDPNEEAFGGGPDPAVARDGIVQFDDNYLAAKHWYQKANDAEKTHPQRMMARILFRHYPQRSQIDYASTMHREGIFGEKARQAWTQSRDEWSGIFGKETHESRAGTVMLDPTREELDALAKTDGIDPQIKQREIDSLRRLTNYLYWRTRTRSEAEVGTDEAHRDIYEGQQLFLEGKTDPSQWRPVAGSCNLLDPANAPAPVRARAAELKLTDVDRRILAVLCSAGKPLDRAVVLEQAKVKLTELYALEEKRVVEGVSEAQLRLESGMAKYERMLRSYAALQVDFLAIEEGMMAVLYWRKLHDLNGKTIPQNHPLDEIWRANEAEVPELELNFKHDLATRR